MTKPNIDTIHSGLVELFDRQINPSSVQVEINKRETHIEVRVDMSGGQTFTFKQMMQLPTILGTEHIDFSSDFEEGGMLSDVTPLPNVTTLVIEATL